MHVMMMAVMDMRLHQKQIKISSNSRQQRSAAIFSIIVIENPEFERQPNSENTADTAYLSAPDGTLHLE